MSVVKTSLINFKIKNNYKNNNLSLYKFNLLQLNKKLYELNYVNLIYKYFFLTKCECSKNIIYKSQVILKK